MLLLAGLISLALCRVSKQQERHESLNQTFATVAALEHAQSDLALLLASASTLAQTSDPQTAGATRQAVGALEEHLGEAHAGALAQDDTGLLTDLDNLIAQIGVVSEITQQRLPDLIAADRSQSTESAAATVGELSRQAYAIHAGLDRLVREQQDDYAAAASAANHAVNVNLWLLMGIMVGAAAAVCATVGALLLPVLRPLASLQASVRAIASGDLGTRARVSGPEEVASLARDFNQMVDERQRADETLQQTATDLERSIEAQRESEERLGTIVANAPVILFAVNQDGVLTLSEGKGLEALGLKPGEAVGLSVFDMFPHVQGMAENIHRALEGEAFTRTEELAGLTFETHCAPLRDGNGQVSGLIGVAIDISERKRTEEALRESEEHLRTVVTNAPVILFVVNRDGVFTLCEGKGLEALGLKPEKVVGLSIFDVFRDRPEIKEKLHRALDSEAFTTTVEIDGVVFEAQCAPLRDRSGQIPGLIGVATDVTERKRMEEALRESEEKYRQIFESAQDIFFRTDLMGTITEASPSAERYGYTREQLIGRSVLDLYENPEDRMAFLEVLLERGEAADYELRLKTGDGRIAHASACGRVLRDSNGAPTGFEGFLRDITERKQMDEALRESEEKFRRIFDNVHDIYYRTDVQGIITDISPSVESFGYTQEELIGTQVLDIYENPDERSALLKALFESGVVIDYEVHLKAGDGRARSTSVSTHLLRGPDGAFAGVEGSLRDISERKRMEKALRESEERYRSLVETSPDAIMLTDLGTRIIMANRQTALLFGFESVAEMLSTGKSAFDFIAPEDRERANVNARETLELRTLRDVEYTLIRKDGSRFSGEMTASLITDADGNPKAFIGVVRDITERKRVEEALREQVRRDPLTGTLNHAVIVEELRSLISSGAENAPHAVAMIDVNDLKIVNDTFGHQVGDEVLITVADALAGDSVLVGRYGGDEFVTILPNADREAAEGYRQDVLASLEDVDLRDPDTGARVPVAVSVGFAIYPAEAERIEDLIKLADSAMYAWRRQRPVLSTVRAPSRSMGGDRAAKMVGEIVPLLTSSGDLNDKLRLVAHRLSVGAGYDAVNFALIRPGIEEPYSLNTFVELPEQTIEAWDHEQRKIGWDRNPMRLLAERGRPIIMDDPQHDQRLTDVERELLRAGGMQSAMVAPMLWRNELVGVLSVASKRKAAFGPRDAQFLMAVAAQVTGIVRMATLVDELQSTSTRVVQAQTETVMMLAAAAEAHDQATGLHLQNVRAITETLACELGYRQEDAEELGLAAVLHDIGKIRVPDVVLSTAGQLTDPEWDLMKQHTVWGGGFLAGRQGFELAATIARSHHERWDGSGYPNGLAGEDIPKAATIVAVADAFDAMTSDRPYRAARSVAAAVREIVACSGSHFNPKVVQALVRLHKRKILRLRRQTLGKLAA
jgi:diguanylate cyclase (GGDEF)-like protein/PAS domain S-box-containing protein